jgi:hypothetical protein
MLRPHKVNVLHGGACDAPRCSEGDGGEIGRYGREKRAPIDREIDDVRTGSSYCSTPEPLGITGEPYRVPITSECDTCREFQCSGELAIVPERPATSQSRERAASISGVAAMATVRNGNK